MKPRGGESYQVNGGADVRCDMTGPGCCRCYYGSSTEASQYILLHLLLFGRRRHPTSFIYHHESSTITGLYVESDI